MPQQTPRSAGELSPFDIADWLWSFRWLAVALFLGATAWTGSLLFANAGSTAVEEPRHDLVIGIYRAGTPVRSVTEIADIYGSRLMSPTRALISEAGAAPVVLRAQNRDAAEAAATESSELAMQLVAEVQAQADTLAVYMRREIVPDFIAEQYFTNTAFLAGVQSGLIEISRPVIREVTSARGTGPGIRLALPWITAGVVFLAVAGVISFVSAWRTRRQPK
ncbi:hypothetical protein [Devosia chinhatensis]|uniref:Uncharacterized protein n=1 Tax=Devosia chinhatensis TaxID=429727 RepID=A0A0F5FJY1_9HYPH|nr:hypothetical protein [Devosia chinhatensis]KKB08890.1 hypothetical protein VE26_02235 [Devosia chinhatensis]